MDHQYVNSPCHIEWILSLFVCTECHREPTTQQLTECVLYSTRPDLRWLGGQREAVGGGRILRNQMQPTDSLRRKTREQRAESMASLMPAYVVGLNRPQNGGPKTKKSSQQVQREMKTETRTPTRSLSRTSEFIKAMIQNKHILHAKMFNTCYMEYSHLNTRNVLVDESGGLAARAFARHEGVAGSSATCPRRANHA